MNRPPRTDAHQRLAAFLARFKDAGLMPVVSTNGGEPAADIQIVKGEKPGEVIDAWVTAHGDVRLAAPTRHRERFGANVSDSITS